MDELIQKIASKELGGIPDHIESITGKGVKNDVFKVTIQNKSYIFRLNEESEFPIYQKEQWCINKAKEAGIPVSECYGIGLEDAHAFMILDYIEGENGIDTDAKRHSEIYKTLGTYARKINSIQVDGFGEYVDVLGRGFADSWEGVVTKSIDEIFGIDLLIERGVINQIQCDVLKKRISELYDWDFEPRLCHGNLGAANTIMGHDGVLFLIDWGNGAGHRAPHFDLAELLTWRSTSNYVDVFIESYGIDSKEFQDIEHDVNTLIALRLLKVIVWMIKGNKEIKDKDFVSGSINRVLELK